MHHDGIHAIGHGEGLEVALDGDRQRELVDEVHGGAGHDGPTAEVLQAEHCTRGSDRSGEKGGQTAGTAEVCQALGVPLPCTLDAQHATPVASALAGDGGC